MKLSVIGFAVACLLVAGSAFASEELSTKNKCTICHQMDANAMGPSMKAIAEKNKGGDAEALAAFIKAGSNGKNTGKYEGIAMPMPPQAAVSDDDAKAMAEWILSLAE
jgi:cytochrome c